MDNITFKLVTDEEELRGALEVRRQVFIQEQCVSQNLEYDGYDEEALHMVVKDRERVIGTARVRFPTTNQAKIERMAVLEHILSRCEIVSGEVCLDGRSVSAVVARKKGEG